MAPNASSDTPTTLPAGPTPPQLNDIVIRFAGDSQDGIQTIGGFLARLAGRSAQEVMTYMTIPSTISGGASIFQVRMGTGDILSAGDEADVLVAFYQHSYDAHRSSLRSGGLLIYDHDHVKLAEDHTDCRAVGVPISTATIETLGGNAKAKGKNIFVLGLIARVFDLNNTKLRGLIREKFKGKSEDIVRNALLAYDAGYMWPSDHLRDIFRKLEEPMVVEDKPQVTMDGNQAMVFGLITAGVRYGAGYPITPWSTIMEQLRAELPKYGGMFVQAEDELGAVSYALGFAYGGHLSITGSSGPGLSLKMEALGWGTMAEIPLIVINVMRGGPSTGLPTSVEQSDLLQAIYGSHGDCPRVVLAARDVEDCFYSCIEAARIAKEYSTPVIVLTDMALASRIEAFDEPDLDQLLTRHQADLSARPADFAPYPLGRPTRHAPPGSIMTSGKYPTVSGLEHDEMGHPNSNPRLHREMTAKRRNKLRDLAATLPVPEVYGDQEGETLLVGWGSTYGPIREATKRARAAGLSVGQLHLRHVHPFPPGLEEIFARFKRILVVELNDEGIYGQGQLATLLRSKTCNPAVTSLCKTDGLTFRVREILAGAGLTVPSPITPAS
jgi:2-oxoglutarate/2-oxoacid ferredoxin oxidoreductase subunit alpha